MSEENKLKQVPYRIYENDYRILRKKLAADKLKFQQLVDCCVHAYLEEDASCITKILEKYRAVQKPPKVLTSKEAMTVLDEIAENEESLGIPLSVVRDEDEGNQQ